MYVVEYLLKHYGASSKWWVHHTYKTRNAAHNSRMSLLAAFKNHGLDTDLAEVRVREVREM